jgi:pentatricopeptide repeat protein
LKENVFVYNTLINGYCKSGQMKEAEKLVTEMNNSGFTIKYLTLQV